MSVELFPAEAWVRERLKSVAERVYLRPAPEGAPLPHVGYARLAEPHLSYVAGEVAFARFEYLIAVVGRDNIGHIKELAEAVRAALHRREGEAQGYRLSAREVAPYVPDPYYLSGALYHEVGGRYRVLVSKA